MCIRCNNFLPHLEVFYTFRIGQECVGSAPLFTKLHAFRFLFLFLLLLLDICCFFIWSYNYLFPSFSNIFYSFRHCLAFGWLAFLANRFSSPTISILWGRITCYFKLNLTTFPYKNTPGDYFQLKDGQNGEKEIYIYKAKVEMLPMSVLAFVPFSGQQLTMINSVLCRTLFTSSCSSSKSMREIQFFFF